MTEDQWELVKEYIKVTAVKASLHQNDRDRLEHSSRTLSDLDLRVRITIQRDRGV